MRQAIQAIQAVKRLIGDYVILAALALGGLGVLLLAVAASGLR